MHMRSSPLLWQVFLALALIMLLANQLDAQPSPAPGSILMVTTTADDLAADGKCSLREAIRAVNLKQTVDACVPSARSNVILLPAGTYTLALGSEVELENAGLTGDLDISTDMTIQGSGVDATRIVGMPFDRVLDIHGSAIVSISDLTISGGQPRAGSGGGIFNRSGVVTLTNTAVSDSASPNRGGGIFNGGSLTLVNSVVRNNSAAQAGGGILNTGTALLLQSAVLNNQGSQGGGVDNEGTLTLTSSIVRINVGAVQGAGVLNRGALTVTNSTIDNNRMSSATVKPGDGGGILNEGTLDLRNSTVSTNTANGSGGGIMNRGTVTLNNATIADNVADSGASDGQGGGGIFTSKDQVTFSNTIIARNTARRGQASDCAGQLRSAGYNLVQSMAGCSITGTAQGNRIGVDPKLGPLRDNGGRVETQALLRGSPAIDAGSPAAPGSQASACLPTDERGVLRPRDGNRNGTSRCDIGAHESRIAIAQPNALQPDTIANPDRVDGDTIDDTIDGP